MKYKLKLPRDLNALTMVGRKSGAFKDQRAGRGGAKNSQQEFLEDHEEASSTSSEDEE